MHTDSEESLGRWDDSAFQIPGSDQHSGLVCYEDCFSHIHARFLGLIAIHAELHYVTIPSENVCNAHPEFVEELNLYHVALL